MTVTGARVELLVLADDLTGALDSTVAFRPRRVLVVPDGSEDLERRLDRAAGEADVVGVDTGSRDLHVDEAVARVRRVLVWVGAQQEPPRVVKKVDSALRGHVRAELEAAAGSAGPPMLLCPALPAQGRTTVAGRHRDARPGSGRAPVLTDLRTLVPAGYQPVPLDGSVLRGPALARRLQELAPGQIALVDAVRDDDLHAVAMCLPLTPRLLVAASSGLLRALARATAAQDDSPVADGADHAERAHPLLVVLATRHAVARAQVARLLREHPRARVVELDLDAVRSGAAPACAAAARQLAAAEPGEVVVLTVPLLPVPAEPAAARAAGALITQALAEVTARFVDASRGELLLLGGDLGAACCRRLGVALLAPVGEPAPGTVLCRVEPVLAGAAVASLSLRSGGFGADDALLTLLGTRSPPAQGGRVV